MKFLTSFLILLLLLSGCSEKKRVVAAPKTLPQWYANPPASTPQTLYAIGEGSERDEAVAHALSNMASTLSVSVSSQYESVTTERQGTRNNYDKSVTSAVQSEVAKIRISNYEVLQSEEYGFREFLVLISASRSALFEGIKNDLDQQFAQFKLSEKNLKNANALKRLKFYLHVKEELSHLSDTLNVLKALRQSFDAASYLDEKARLDGARMALHKSVSFEVRAPKEDAGLATSLEAGISKASFQLSRSGGSGHFVVEVSSSAERAEAQGFTLARTAIALQVRDANGVVVGSNKLSLIGQSTQGYAIAKQNVAYKLSVMIEKEGIEKVLGIDAI